MKNIILSPKALVMVSGSSKGTQPKYYEGGYWYKIDKVGYEGLAERLASLVLSCSNVKNYVKYEQCLINHQKGCRCKSFLQEDESFISFERLHKIHTNREMLSITMNISEPAERIQYVKNFVLQTTGFDCSEYLSLILTLDALILNIDRHFNNLGIIINDKTGEVRSAPIFDNGAALFSNLTRFPYATYDENINHVLGQPFSVNLEQQAYEAGVGLKLDYNRLYRMLDKEPDSRALETLCIQLEKEKSLIVNIN